MFRVVRPGTPMHDLLKSRMKEEQSDLSSSETECSDTTITTSSPSSTTTNELIKDMKVNEKLSTQALLMANQLFSLTLRMSGYYWKKISFVLFDYDQYYLHNAIKSYLEQYCYVLAREKSESVENSVEYLSSDNEVFPNINQPNSYLIILLFCILV